jgi:hypothetical protein
MLNLSKHSNAALKPTCWPADANANNLLINSVLLITFKDKFAFTKNANNLSNAQNLKQPL